MSLKEEIINFCGALVAIPSQNHINSEEGMAEAVFSKLRGFGFKPEIIGTKEHPSVICHLEKPGAKKVIWLEAMLDTVPAGDETKWDYPPFEGKIDGSRMYGRGVADSKIAIAIFSYLAKELYENPEFNASIFLGFDADEQGGNFTGIKEILKHAPRADICILGYQGKEVSIGARGWLRLTITTLGKSAHTGSRLKKGVNAIHLMAQVINSVNQLGLDAKTQPFFEFGSSLNVSQISGGKIINVVPDRCEAKLDIRLIPSQSKEEVLAQIKQAIKNIGDIEYTIDELGHEPAYLTDPNNEFVKILQSTAQGVLGEPPPLIASGQGSAGNVISKLGIPIINAFGVESDNVHAPNEWINVDTIPQVFEIYKQALLEYCK